MEPYDPSQPAGNPTLAVWEGEAAAADARDTRKRLRRRTRPGSAVRDDELHRALERVRAAKRRLRRFNARAAYYDVPRDCQRVADELRLEYQQLWKMLKRGEGRAV